MSKPKAKIIRIGGVTNNFLFCCGISLVILSGILRIVAIVGEAAIH